MSNFPRTDKSISDDFAWRVAGYLDENKYPTIEVSSELDQELAPEQYLPIIGEGLILLGMTLLKHDSDDFESVSTSNRRPKPYPTKSQPPVVLREIESGGYL